MTLPLVIVGAGGFGRETVDVVLAQNAAASGPKYDLLGVVDSNPSSENLDRLRRSGIPYLGEESRWLAKGFETCYLVGVGNPAVRRLISARFSDANNIPGLAIHPSATIGSLSTLGAGSIVCSGAQISTNVLVGMHVHINPNVTVGHDTFLDDYVSLNPGSIVSGDVRCEEEVLVGAGAVILQGLTVGAGSTVGAAACVTRNVDPDRTVKGIPAS